MGEEKEATAVISDVCAAFLFILAAPVRLGLESFSREKALKRWQFSYLLHPRRKKSHLKHTKKKLAAIHWDNWININLEREAFIKEFKTILQGGMNKWWRKFTRLFKVNFISIQSSAGKVANNCNFRCQIVVHSVAEVKFSFLVVWPSVQFRTSFSCRLNAKLKPNFGELFLHWWLFDLFSDQFNF